VTGQDALTGMRTLREQTLENVHGMLFLEKGLTV